MERKKIAADNAIVLKGTQEKAGADIAKLKEKLAVVEKVKNECLERATAELHVVLERWKARESRPEDVEKMQKLCVFALPLAFSKFSEMCVILIIFH